MPLARTTRPASHRPGALLGEVALTLLALATFLPASAHAADDTALHLANVSAVNTAYVRIPNSTAFNLQQFTIEAWVQRTGTGYGATADGVGGAIVAKPAEGTVGSFLGPWYLTWNNSGQAFFSVTHTSGVNGVTLQSGAVSTPLGRHHLAAVVAADSVHLYVDGARAASAAWTLGSVLVTTNDVLLGACNFGSGFLRRLDGSIDDVRIWDHARTASEIAGDMNCRLAGTEPGLVAYYRFDAGSLVDDSGHGHTGAAVATAGSLTYIALSPLTACVTDVGPTARPAFATLAAWPQPTRGPLQVRFSLPAAGRAAVAAYDVAGRRLLTFASGHYERGDYVVTGDLSQAGHGPAAAGVRFVRLEWEGRTIARTVVVIP